jgi:hypothetical protein
MLARARQAAARSSDRRLYEQQANYWYGGGMDHAA